MISAVRIASKFLILFFILACPPSHACDLRTEAYELIIGIPKKNCEDHVKSVQCQAVYGQIKASGREPADYRPSCSVFETNIFTSQTASTAAAIRGCTVGAVKGTAGEIYDQVRSLVSDLSDDYYCNHHIDYKRNLIIAYNKSLAAHPELQIEVRPDRVLNAYSCYDIYGYIREEGRYKQVVYNRTHPKKPALAGSTNDGLLTMAYEWLKKQDIEIGCYSEKKRAELVCEALGNIALAATPLEEIQVARGLAGLLKIRRLNTIADGVGESELASARLPEPVNAVETVAPIKNQVAPLCDDCPPLNISEQNRSHYLEHSQVMDMEKIQSSKSLTDDEKKQLVQEILPMSRENRETTVLSSNIGLDDLLKNVKAENFAEISTTHPERRLFRGRVQVDGDPPKTYEIDVVFCAEPSCDGGSLKKGDVITTYARCGPDVVKIPRLSTLQKYLAGEKSWRDVGLKTQTCK